MEKVDTETINLIRQKTDIVSVISSYLPLTKRGKNYFGICPFHDDNNPSMSVSTEKQMYKCFSCGAAGNVFTFVKEYENIPFIEAVSILGEKCGITVKYNKGNTQVENKNSALYEIYELASKFYQNNIHSKEAKEAKDYLSKRNIDETVIREFKIGLALRNSSLLAKLLTSKNFTNKDLKVSGLLIEKGLDYSDLYYNRIMFPLYDLNGNVVGFSGRIYNIEDPSKYINTRETPIFKKGELLYNYHRAKNEARKEGKIIIVEGFLDVIRAYTVGIYNVVATMGTAVTKTQAHLIKKMAKEVILCFDGDEAGAKATIACANELLNIGVTPKVVRLEDNMDPDEYILKKGQEDFLKKLEYPITILDFKRNYLKKDKNLNSIEETSLYVKEMVEELSKIDDDILRELTLKKISEDTNLDIEFLKEKLKEKNNIVKVEKKTKIKKETNKKNKYEKAERYLLYYMLQDKEVVKMYSEAKPYLPDTHMRMLALEILHFYKETGKVELADIISEINGREELTKSLNEIILLDLKETYTKEQIYDYFKVIREFNIEYEINRLKKQMKEETIPKEKAKLAQKIIELKVEENQK